MPNILIICTGNVCRSPVVEALYINRLCHKNSGDWAVQSAGTHVNGAVPASRFSVEVIGETEGIDISQHRSQPATAGMVKSADLVICMSAGHKEILSLENPAEAGKIYLLSELVPGPTYDVVDPFGKDKKAYQMMVKTVTGLVDKSLERVLEIGVKS